MNKRVLIPMLAAALLWMLPGCGGGSSAGGAAGGTAKTTTKWVLGHAAVCAYAITNGIKGAQIGQCATTDPVGDYIIDAGAKPGNVLLEATGGSYLDLATGVTATLATPLHTVSQGGQLIVSAGISPLTDALVLIAAQLPGGLIDANLATARNALQGRLGFDPASAGNVDPAQPSALTTSSVDKVHGLYLAALFQYLKTHSSLSLLDAIHDLVREIRSAGVTGSAILLTAVNDFLASPRNQTGIKDAPGFDTVLSSLGARPSRMSVTPPVVTPKTASVIMLENRKTAAQGASSKWQISNPALNNEIEGYASATSINRGETIDLYVNTIDPSFTLSIYRIGWYGGAGARLMLTTSLPGQVQAACPTNAATLMTECDWQRSYSLSVPNNTADLTDWASGVYLAKLIGSSGKQHYIIFVVRDDDHTSDFLFQASFTTYQAYNKWGGNSYYASSSTSSPAAFNLSFNRPYFGSGAGDFLGWEVDLVQFMEKEGYDVSYSTSIDTHVAGARLMNHKAFLSAGHDEYWTKEIRDNIERARDAGVSIGFVGANAGYWQIRLEPDARQDKADRTMIGYRNVSPKLDPVYGLHPELSAASFRSVDIHRPEAALIGVMYDYNSLDSDLVVSDCSSFVCAGTGLVPGTKLPHMLGYEVDRLDASSPAGIQVFASSPYSVCDNPPGCSLVTTRYSSATYYQAPSGALVFATGSMQWNWGLSLMGSYFAYTNKAVQQMTRNLLNRLIGKP